MNAKKCKQIRKSLRNSGVDWREKEYETNYKGITRLVEHIGRLKYQWVKKVAV